MPTTSPWMSVALAVIACWAWSAILGPSSPQRGPADPREHVKWLLGGQLVLVAALAGAYLVGD